MKDDFNFDEEPRMGYVLRKFSTIDEAFSQASSAATEFECMMTVLNDETFFELVLRAIIRKKEYDLCAVKNDTDEVNYENSCYKADGSDLLSFDFFLKSKNGYYYTCHRDAITDVKKQQEIFEELSETYDFASLIKEVEETVADIDSIQKYYDNNSSYYTHRDRFMNYWKCSIPDNQKFINLFDYILYKHGLPSYLNENNDEPEIDIKKLLLSLPPEGFK